MIKLLGFWTPGPWELIIILTVMILIFGRRIPEIIGGIGRSLAEFRKGINESFNKEDEIHD